VEILNVSPELDCLFTQKASYHELLTTARKQGFRTMQEQAKSLLKTKELTVENIQDVLAYDDTL
jgi:type II secretory ATPase GspE/PulE/Tfp pilus assembly ATPase PilB-like protein